MLAACNILSRKATAPYDTIIFLKMKTLGMSYFSLELEPFYSTESQEAKSVDEY